MKEAKYTGRHRLVSYEGDGDDNFYRRASGERPTGSEDKPLKVLDRRKATPREDMEIAKAQYRGRPIIFLSAMVNKFPQRWSS